MVRVEIVVVREAFDFTISNNTTLPVTYTPHRMSKQPSKSSKLAGVERLAGGYFPPPAPQSAALPNFSAFFPPACIRMVSFVSAFAQSLHHFLHYMENFSISSQSSLAWEKRSGDSMAFVATIVR